jgi:photosystem II stability/assembly factor-like uncharacterized protein
MADRNEVVGRLMKWIVVSAIALVAAVGAAKSVPRAKRILWRPVLAARPADTDQVIAARDPDIVGPPRLDQWRIIGPGGGGTFYGLAVSPHDPNLVFANTDMTECYVSENGGRTWRQINLRNRCSVLFDPKSPNRVYAMAGMAGLWRSDDRGRSWNLVFPQGDGVPIYMDDEAEVVVHAQGYYGITALAIDPDDSNTLYAGNDGGELWISRDAGKQWKSMAKDVRAQAMWVDPTSPRESRRVYTLSGGAIGTWDGSTFVTHDIKGTTGDLHGTTFGLTTDGRPVIYVATDLRFEGDQPIGGIMASYDAGATWHGLNDGLLKLAAKGTFPGFSAIGISARHAEVLYVAFNQLHVPSDNKQYFGVMKTSNGGVTWTMVRKESGTMAENVRHDWIASQWGPDWADEPLSIGVDDNNPDLVFTGDLGRVTRSDDGGKNWTGVYSQSTGKGYTTNGLDVTTAYGLHFDPFDPKRMFISYTDIGLFRSEDGGESWATATAHGVPFSWRHNTYWVEFDPAVRGKMWAVMTSKHDLPRTRMLNLYGGAEGGVAASVDGGDTWTLSSDGLPKMVPTHILLDPKSPASARVLYVTGFGKGIFKSTDGGRTWSARNGGLPPDPLTWRMAMDRDGTLYVVTIRRSLDGQYGNDKDGWLFRSRDGADTWERVALPPGLNGPMAITPDPDDPKRLYLAAWARYTLYSAAEVPPDGGVFLSTDSGQHWTNVMNGSSRIYDVTVDPRNTNLVYACGFESSAWRSADRGKTWSRIRGYNFKDGHRVIPDPLDSSKIYITTFGSSVWHGPAQGDPNAPEDIAGPASMMFRSVLPNRK